MRRPRLGTSLAFRDHRVVIGSNSRILGSLVRAVASSAARRGAADRTRPDGDPYGTRTRVFAVRGRRPGPLDEGAIGLRAGHMWARRRLVKSVQLEPHKAHRAGRVVTTVQPRQSIGDEVHGKQPADGG